MAVSTSPAPVGSTGGAPHPSPSADATDRGPRIPHIRPLDGLRGVAVLAVVVFHFAPDVAPGGFLGVDMFFVLSGFLITSLLVAERESTGGTALREFWIRRARRLFPALFLVLLAVGLWSILKATPLETTRLRDDGLAAIGYVANWRFIFSGQSYIEEFIGIGPSPLRHTWSLAIEEQFYLVWPLVVAGLGVLVARRARRGHPEPGLRRVIIVVCLVAAALSIVVMALLFTPGDDPSRVYYGTDTRAHLLLIGAALGAATAGVVAVARENARRAIVVVGSLAAVGLVAAFLTVDATDAWLYDAGYGGIAIGVALIIAAAGQQGTNPLARLLATRPLVGLGLISYGVYLWHWPIAVWFDEQETGLDGVALFALRAVLTLGVSLLSYYLVEMPIRRGALRRINPALPRILAPFAVVLAVIVLFLPTWGVARIGETGTPEVASVGTEAVTAAYADVPRCDGDLPAKPPESTDGIRVDLIGNSVAGEIKDCLGAILGAYGIEYRAFTQQGAAICDFFPFLEDRYDEPKAQRPDAVVLYFLTISKTDCTEGREGKALDQQYAREMRSVVERWREAGVDVYLVPPMPAAGEGGESGVAAAYRKIASTDPDHIQVLDTGTYLRDGSGTYQYRMPCLPDGELGCEPDGLVGVRLTLDREHMCTDVNWRIGACDPKFAAGERRGAAAIAAPLLLTLGK